MVLKIGIDLDNVFSLIVHIYSYFILEKYKR